MANGTVVAICIASAKGLPMQSVESVEAVAGSGLVGDRYFKGEGSWNKGKPSKRQVTLMNAWFFEGSGFTFAESRRNIFTRGVELMWLIGREFQIGKVRFRGVKYCDPCQRPSSLSGNFCDFQEVFHDRGGLIAEVLESGIIRLGDTIIAPKDY